MKKIITLLSVVLTSSFSFAQCGSLFFSEYIEGSSNNKALEIYNPTASPINLAKYAIYRHNNGATVASDSLKLTGTLNPGAVYVIGNSSGNATILAESDITHTITFYNGDDAIYIIDTLTRDTLDMIGIVGEDPGTNWVVGTGATSEFTLIRKPTVHAGTKSWAVGATQWDVYPQDMVDSLGAHSVNACTPNSIENTLSLQASIYPNPTQGEFFIRLEENKSLVQVAVYNSVGVLVDSFKATNTNAVNVTLNGTNGLYFIEIKDEFNAKATIRVIKN